MTILEIPFIEYRNWILDHIAEQIEMARHANSNEEQRAALARITASIELFNLCVGVFGWQKLR